MLQKKSDDMAFPYSNEFLNLPLSYQEKMKFEPPSMVLRRNFFTSKHKKLKKHPVGPPAPRVEPGSNQLNSTDQWREMTHSLGYFSNFSLVIPNGHGVRRGIVPCFDVEGRYHQYVQPSTHVLEYRDLQVEPPSILLPGNPVISTPNANHDEPQARRYVASTKKQFLVSSGHPESTTSSCCLANHLLEPPRDREVLRVLQQPTCETNSSVRTIMNNFNLNDKGLDEGNSYVHIFSVETDFQEDQELKDHLLKLAKSMKYDDITVDDIEDYCISEEQLGVVKIDSGLEMSLSLDKKEKLLNGSYAFLEDSEKFQKEKEEFETEGSVG